MTERASPGAGNGFNRLFPRIVDNTYRGRTVALWIFAFVVSVRIFQSVLVIVNGSSIVAGADGIPLDTYPAAAAQTILALYALYAVARLLISVPCVLAFVRYRSAIPFMFALILLNYLAARVVALFLPIARVGTPPASIVTPVLIALTAGGLVLSLWTRRDRDVRE